jgi:BirA family biotin operon repressor/biotin-[acetyl-CoA-carboxylase] ligase
LAESTFDRDAFTRALDTRVFGRRLIREGTVESTNDVAWDLLAEGPAGGTVVVSDAQTRGRGRAGRAWHATPGRALVLSIALETEVALGAPGVLPLAAGLALTDALDALGARVRLKWPNDVLAGSKKLAGILCESRRRRAQDERGGGDAIVVGVGVNVSDRPDDLPAGIPATSLAIEGVVVARESVAAGFLNAFEPLWTALLDRRAGAVIERWTRRADFWGESVTVRGASGSLSGIARALDPDGGLVIRQGSGIDTTVLAGDLELGPAADARS